MKIVGSEEFGLCFSCLIRLYKWQFDFELLKLIDRTCDEYLYYFSIRTIFCSLRDLMQEKNYIFSPEVPREQRLRFESLIIKLTRQYIALVCTEEMSLYAKEEKIKGLGIEAGFVKGIYTDTRFQTHLEFRQWLSEKRLDVLSGKTVFIHKNVLPIKKTYYDDFQKICIYTVHYSMGRKTYMPCTCYTFIKNNLQLLRRETKNEICKYIGQFLEEEKDENWRRLKEVLSA